MRSVRKAEYAVLAATTLFACVCAFGASGAASDAGYRLLTKYKVAGAGTLGAVQVDSATRRVYVTAGNHIEVLDADTGKKLGEIPVAGARDIVLVPRLKRGFAVGGPGSSLTIFDTETSRIVKVVPIPGKAPEALAYDPGTKRIFVAENGSGEVASLDAQSGDLISSVALKGQLGQMVSNGYGELFVAADHSDAIHVVDTRMLKLLGDFPVHRDCQPSALALDPSGRRLFVACSDGGLQVIDTDIGFTFETLPIGTGAAAETFTFTPQGEGGWKGATFVVTSDGTLSLVRMDAFIHYSIAGKLALQPGLRSIAYDSKTHHLFVSAGSTLLVVGQ